MRERPFFEKLKKPVNRNQIILEFSRNKAVLDIGCVNHNIKNTVNENWLHKNIKQVANRLVGIDYLKDDVNQLNKDGFNVIFADITKPLLIGEKFDVIVIGNLIEHLSNFEGLFNNIKSCLKEDGLLLISTANPFYKEQYFYTSFKNDIIINPEHTCWIDPIALDQLANRFDFETKEVYWIKEKWRLGQVICHSETMSFDMFTGRWSFCGDKSLIEKMTSPLLLIIISIFFPAINKKISSRYHQEEKGRFIYLQFISLIFEFIWRIYRIVIISSPINNYELFLSVLKNKKN